MGGGTTAAARPAVAIVLVNWNNWRDCIENIDTLLAQDYPRFHIYVVDNDSSDNSIENILGWCARPVALDGWRPHEGVFRLTSGTPVRPISVQLLESPDAAQEPAPPDCRLTLVRSGANRGFAGGCNVGVRCAGLGGYSWFWFLNTDTVVHRDALSHLVARGASDDRVGMIGSTVLYYDRPDTVQALGGAHWDQATATSAHIGEGTRLRDTPGNPLVVEKELSYIFGASMLVSASLVREVGLMAEDYFLYYEEFDWSMRSRDAFSLGYAAGSHVFHKAGASSSRVMPLASARHFYRNRVRFVARFHPERLGTVRRGLLVEALRYAAKMNWSRARLVASIALAGSAIARDARATRVQRVR
jgi:GT2 family glycosyltransferase